MAYCAPMSAVRIQWAGLSDLDAVREIFRAASLWNVGDRDTLLAHPEVLVLPDDGVVERRTLVAVDGDGVIVGFATLQVLDQRAWELEDLFVAPAHMRRGIATALAEDLVSRAGRTVDRIEVTANPHAMAFYRSVGFVDDGVSETRFGPAPRMRLDVHHR